MAFVCQLHEAGCRLSVGCVCVLCQLLETEWRFSEGCVYNACYLKQDGDFLSVTWDRLVVFWSVCAYFACQIDT